LLTIFHLDKNTAPIATGGVEEGANGFDRSTVPADDPTQIFGVYPNAEEGTPVIPRFLDVYFVGMRDQTAENELKKVSHENFELT
jgi:hypothetical protein